MLEHGKFVMGPEVLDLEDRLSARTGASSTIACASGTDALLLPLLALGVGPGDAVVVPAFTFAATAEAVALAGATPVFADCGLADGNLDAGSADDAVEVARALGLRPVGIIPVDLYGQPADYGSLEAVAKPSKLWILADAAQSLGSTDGGRKVGTFGRVTATSFFPSKPLGCYGDGGAIFTDDPELAEVLRSLINHGAGTHRYEHVRVGVNGRLDTLQAAVLLQKLGIFDEELEARQRVADGYAERLGGIVEVPHLRRGVTSAWAQYTVRVANRDGVAEAMRKHGVPTAVHYPKPLNSQLAYAKSPMAAGGVPNAIRLAATVLSLPMHPYLEESTQDRISEALVESVKALA